MSELEIRILAMNMILDIKLNSRAEKRVLRRRGCNKFSESIKYNTPRNP